MNDLEKEKSDGLPQTLDRALKEGGGMSESHREEGYSHLRERTMFRSDNHAGIKKGEE